MTAADWAAVAAVAAGCSAAFAAIQIWLDRRDSNRRQALDLLRRVGECLRPLAGVDLDEVRSQIMSVYRSGGRLSRDASRYLDLLDAIDLAALAVEGSVADRRLLEQHLATVVRKEVVPSSFVTDLRDACNDQNVYEHLYRFIGSIRERAALTRPQR